MSSRSTQEQQRQHCRAPPCLDVPFHPHPHSENTQPAPFYQTASFSAKKEQMGPHGHEHRETGAGFVQVQDSHSTQPSQSPPAAVPSLCPVSPPLVATQIPVPACAGRHLEKPTGSWVTSKKKLSGNQSKAQRNPA